MELDNVSFKELLGFDITKFDYYVRVGLLMKGSAGTLSKIDQWPYGKVKELQIMFTSNVTYNMVPQILSFCHDKDQEDYLKMKWHEVFRRYNHIVNEVNYIVEREKILIYEPDADQVEAGIGRIGTFGVMATVDTLASGNVLLYDDIEKKPYYLIFAKLHLESEKARYIENLRRIKSRKKQ